MIRLGVRMLFGLLYLALSLLASIIAFTAWFSDGGTLWERLILSPGVPLATWAVLASIGFEAFYRALRPWILAGLGLVFLGLVGVGVAMANEVVRGDYSLIAALALIPLLGIVYLEVIRPRLGMNAGWGEVWKRQRLAR